MSDGPSADGHATEEERTMSRQVGFIAVAVMASITLIILAFKEVDHGRKWHEQGLRAAKHLSQDNSHLVPLLFTPGVEPRTFEHGDYSVGDEGGAPIDQWLSGAGGADQAAAAVRDAGLEKKPVAMVHVPEKPEGPAINEPERQVWGALDFEKEEADQLRQANAAAAALDMEKSLQEPQTHSNNGNGPVEVKKLMTAKSFAKWKRCMDYYSSGKVTADMMQVIENGDLKPAPHQVAHALQGLTKQGCVFFTQNCLRASRPELVTAKQTKTFTPKEYNKLPPALPRNALGSCAIVGHSDRLLGQTRGFEIDAHTTVIRIGFFLRKSRRSPPVQFPSGPPVSGFEMHVGYKTDFVFLPTGRVYTSPRMPQNTNTTMWQTQEWQIINQPDHVGIRQMAGRGKYQPLITGARNHIYEFFKNTRLRSAKKYASDELTAVLWWLSSGLCKTIDVYGMAFPQYGEKHSRAYWSTANYESGSNEPWPGPSVPAQNAALEMYAMHAAMREGLLCVHTH